jgi:hypothetical protein
MNLVIFFPSHWTEAQIYRWYMDNEVQRRWDGNPPQLVITNGGNQTRLNLIDRILHKIIK